MMSLNAIVVALPFLFEQEIDALQMQAIHPSEHARKAVPAHETPHAKTLHTVRQWQDAGVADAGEVLGLGEDLQYGCVCDEAAEVHSAYP